MKGVTICYVFINLQNGKLYLGSAKASNSRDRFNDHLRSPLKTSKNLREDVKKIGWENFGYGVVSTHPSDIDTKELRHIEHVKIIQLEMSGLLYNTQIKVGNDRSPSEETKKKIAATLKGRKTSDETKGKISAAQKGRTFSDETRRLMSQSAKLRKSSAETKAKISRAGLGRKVGADTKEKISLALKGRIMSQETKDKISASKRRDKKEALKAKRSKDDT